jgi:peptidyl-prolyl cis-trans isomerase SurA
MTPNWRSPADAERSSALSRATELIKTMSAALRSLPLVASLLAVLICWSAPVSAQSSIRVIVNGEVITSYDISQRARLLPLFGDKGGEKAATDGLIDDILKLQAAKKRNIAVGDAQIDAAYANLGKDRKLSASQLTQELGRMGIAAETMKRWIKVQMTWQQLVQARVRQEGQVKSSDIMSAMLEKGSPDAITVTEYMLQQIIFVVPSGSSPNVFAQRRREAEGFRQRFPGCEQSLAFAKNLKGVVVRDAGRRDTTQLRGDQGDEIKATEQGKTTRPFQSEKGIELFAVCSKRDFRSNAGVRTEVENKLRLEQAKTIGEDYLKELREAAVIQRR